MWEFFSHTSDTRENKSAGVLTKHREYIPADSYQLMALLLLQAQLFN